MNILQFHSNCRVVWNGLCDQVPEFLGMVKLPKMAEFVDDDVVYKGVRQQGYLVIEVEVTCV